MFIFYCERLNLNKSAFVLSKDVCFLNLILRNFVCNLILKDFFCLLVLFNLRESSILYLFYSVVVLNCKEAMKKLKGKIHSNIILRPFIKYSLILKYILRHK